jgi:uncharacterized membrane protein YfbV (UPF0208 family)
MVLQHTYYALHVLPLIKILSILYRIVYTCTCTWSCSSRVTIFKIVFYRLVLGYIVVERKNVYPAIV